MDFRILGPLAVREEDRDIPVPGSKQRALLGLLLLHGNETLSTDRVIDELWGDEPPATATKSVQVHVSRLRKALATGPGNGANGVLLTRDHGYELRVEPEMLDAHRFERLAGEGARTLADGRAEDAVEALEAALALWRGPPLSDLASEPFAQPEIARLDELRLVAVERLIKAKLALGEHDAVIGRLEALIREHPYRERLRALLMLALYRADRQADALQAYTNARRTLVGDLGIEPGEHLRELERQILAQDPALALPAPETLELPPELDSDTPLAGRGEDVAWLREHWRRARAGTGRLVAVTGPSGIGKTRLAAELARSVLRERAQVAYAPGADAGRTASALARALESARPALLVLDDLGVPPDGLDRLASTPVLVLVTAEESAPVRGAATRRLAPLCAEDVAAIARRYLPRGDIPVESLLDASGGIPGEVHRAAAAWARAETERRLDGAAGRAAAGRSDLRVAEDDLAGTVVELQALRERARPREDVVACPFKGLAPFELDDAELFFGRERLVAEMVARLPGAPLMGIVGPSGSGKSSALRAGLLAVLRAGVLPGSESWTVSLLRPGEHPLHALESRAGVRGREVIAIDQFEEVFTACADEAERAAFADALVATAREAGRPLVLIAVRADFYGRCAAYPELARLLGANHVLVGAMRRDELRRAIELPARRAGLRVEPELTDALVADVEREPGGLPLLSSALVELWQHRDGRALRMSAYEHTGGVRSAVARLAERAYARLDEPQRETARRILLRLAGEGEGAAVVRRRARIDELEADRDPVIAGVLSVLADARLVTVSEGEAEVAHEALLREWPRLRGWLAEDAQARGLQLHLRAAAGDWDAGGRDAGELYRGARLASTLEWSGAHEADLNATEREFLAESSAAANRSQRRLRMVLAGVSALLVLAVVAGAIALHQRGNARDEATTADAQRLGARALLDPQLDRALLLARQGVALDDSARTRGNLLSTLLRSPAAVGVIRAGSATVESAAVDPRMHLLAVGDNEGRLQLFDTRSRQRLRTLEPTGVGSNIQALGFSSDGSLLAAVHTSVPGTTAELPNDTRWIVTMLDARTRRIVRRIVLPRDTVATGVVFEPGDATLDVSTHGGAGGRLLRLDARTGRPRAAPVPFHHPGRLTFDPFQNWPRSAALTTAGGRRVFVGGVDGAAVRDAATLAVVRRFPQASQKAIGTLPTAYAVTADGRTAAIGGENGTVRLLDLADGTLRTVAGRHRGAVNEIAFAPDGRTLASTSEDGQVIVWDARSAAQVEALDGHTRSAFSPAFADGLLYTASLDGTVLIWDVTGEHRLGRRFAAGSVRDGSSRYALSSDGTLLAHGRGDGTLNLIDMRTLRRRAAVRVVDDIGVAGPDAVEGIRFVPGTHTIVVGTDYGRVAVVDADRAAVVGWLRGHPDADPSVPGKPAGNTVYTPGVSADGRLVATTSADGTTILWSLPGWHRLGAPLRFRRGGGASDGQLSPDGRWLAVQTLSREVVQDREEIWDVRTRRRVRVLRPPGGVSYARFSPDGRLLAVADLQRRMHLYSTATWKPATDFLVDAGAAWVAFSPDSATLAAGADDGTVRLFDVTDGQALGTLPGVTGTTAVPMFTPGGNGLVAGERAGTATLWDLRPDSLARRACAIAGRRLTRAEWDAALPGRPYEPAC